jgi:hypothetical protein
LYKNDKKLKTLVKGFEERHENPGSYYEKSLAAAKFLIFQNNQLHKKIGKMTRPQISPNAEIRKLSQIFRLSEREMIRGFREFHKEKKFPDKVFPLKCVLDSTAISSIDCEQGFSQMNLIVTPSRASLLTETISALLFIKIVSPPLNLKQFDPTMYVKSWLSHEHHSALDTKSKHRN